MTSESTEPLDPDTPATIPAEQLNQEAQPTVPVEQETGEKPSKPSYPESGGKTYRFQGSSSDFGEVSPVASLKTTRGEVARGETIELSDEEAEALKKKGFDLAEEGGDD